MKRVIIALIIIIFIVCISTLVVLNNRNNTEVNPINNIVDSNMLDDTNLADNKENADIIEIRGVKYKNINSIPNAEKSFDNNLVYAEPIRDESGLYVKISDDFFINESKEVRKGEFDSEKRITQIEMIPSKIYSSDEDSNYLYNYGDETFYIPVEKCNAGEERIVYRDYGLELIKKNDGIKINGEIASDVISGWDLRDSSYYNGELRYDDVSLCEAFMETWKINENDMSNWNDTSINDYIKRRSEYTTIYQVDFDDDKDSLEFIYTSGIMDHVHIDSTCPCYSVITYSDDKGTRKFDERMLWFNNVLNYKNIFYGYEAFEYGDKIDKVILIKEDIITGYYIFDKEQGLIHVDRFANGEKFDESGFKKLSELALTLDGKHVIKKDENGKNRIDAFPMYDREYLYDENGDIVTNEDGSYKEDPNSKYIEEGTKIYIKYINEDGYSFDFKTEDGTEYTINYYYI